MTHKWPYTTCTCILYENEVIQGFSISHIYVTYKSFITWLITCVYANYKNFKTSLELKYMPLGSHKGLLEKTYDLRMSLVER